ncbi:hypothetical protein VPH35_040077 [Triticum aestivum]
MLVSRPAAGPSSSRAPCHRTGRWRPSLAGLLGLGTGGRPWFFSWASGGSRVRWCQGLGCRGGGPGGGSAVLMGRARGLVLLGCHGRVGGVVAGVWCSVAVSGGRGENLLYLRTGRRRQN